MRLKRKGKQTRSFCRSRRKRGIGKQLETRRLGQEKKARLDTEAKAIAEGGKKGPDGKKPLYVKYGLNHCVALVECVHTWLLFHQVADQCICAEPRRLAW